MESTHTTIVKEIISKNYTLALLEAKDGYMIYLEHLGTQNYMGNYESLKDALVIFDELLSQVHGH